MLFSNSNNIKASYIYSNNCNKLAYLVMNNFITNNSNNNNVKKYEDIDKHASVC